MWKKAMILAAGLGTRLRPMTNHLPKPLVPIQNRSLLEHTLSQLAGFGVKEVMINLHYLPEKIKEEIGNGEKWGLQIFYSLESPEVLGTGGGLAKVKDFFKDEDAFLFVNGDILHNVDFRAVMQEHIQKKSVATLIVREHSGDPKVGWVGVNQKNEVKRVPDMDDPGNLIKKHFMGLHILSPLLFEFIEPISSCILRTGYRKMIEQGHPVIAYDADQASWKDIGTPESYLDANFSGLKALSHKMPPPIVPKGVTIYPPVYFEAGVNFKGSAELGPNVVIGSRAEIGDGVVLSNCVIWKDAIVEAEQTLNNTIFFEQEKLTL